MQIGHHVSISGSLANAVTNANERECSAFQIFTGNPRGWYTKDITDEEALKFKNNLSQTNIDRFATVAHMPYLPNLSSPEPPVYEKSIKAMIREVKRCDQIGIPFLVTHLGSHKGTGAKRNQEVDKCADRSCRKNQKRYHSTRKYCWSEKLSRF